MYYIIGRRNKSYFLLLRETAMEYETLQEAKEKFNEAREALQKSHTELNAKEAHFGIYHLVEEAVLVSPPVYSLQPLALPSPTYTTASELSDEIPL